MRKIMVALWVAAIAACLDRPGVPCGSGVCAEGTVCIETVRERPQRRSDNTCSGTSYQCVDPVRVEACNGLVDGTPCAGPGEGLEQARVCTSGFCPDTAEPFRFSDRVTIELGIGPPDAVATGDFDGDCISDLVWNHRSPVTNEVAIGFGVGDGSFRIESYVYPGDTPVDWTKHELLVGDFNGDRRDDLAWNRLDVENEVAVLLSEPGRSFSAIPVQVHSTTPWFGCSPRIGDFDGANGDDVAWSCLSTGQLRIFVALADGTGKLTLNPEPWTSRVLEPWDEFELFVGDMNGDERDDLIYNLAVDARNATWTMMLSDPPAAGAPRFVDTATERSRPGWLGYQRLVADATGDGAVDIVFTHFINPVRTDLPIHRSDGRSDGTFVEAPLQRAPAFWRMNVQTAAQKSALTADINGDGRADLIYIASDGGRRMIFGAIATLDTVALYDFAQRSVQPLPFAADWTQFKTLVGDFDGDLRDDLVFDDSDFSGRLYIGLGR